jgi:PEP-CTERM motif-containing protein
VAVALFWTALAASQVSADSILFNIGVPNTDLTPFPSPYGTVNVNRTSTTTATITFNGLTTGGFTYFFGAAQAIDVNVNATAFTAGVPTAASLDDVPVPGNVSAFGTFNVTYDNFDGFNSRFSTTSFDLTNTGGTWASASDVLSANSDGYRAAAHIFVTATSCEDACVTGFAGDGGLEPVPEPATLLLLGSSLLGLAFAGRKKLIGAGAESDTP